MHVNQIFRFLACLAMSVLLIVFTVEHMSLYDRRCTDQKRTRTLMSSHHTESKQSLQIEQNTSKALISNEITATQSVTVAIVNDSSRYHRENGALTSPSPTERGDSIPIGRKVILLWTGLYRSRYFMFGAGAAPFQEKCPVHESNCLTTADQEDMSHADAVVFFMFPMGAQLWKQNISARMPPRGRDGQVYVFWNDEPPVYATYEKLYGLQGVFNVTVTYRLDSTIPLPVYHLEEVPEPEIQPAPNWTEVLSKKTKLVAWVVSACQKTHSQRMAYVRVLQQHIPVDVYGRCGNLTLKNCSGYHCFEELQTTYKFYLAFENSICRDYITEKAFRTLEENWVPVVLGGGDYSKRLPPHSYIDVHGFPSPAHLAAHLLHLDRNPHLYLEYFRHRRGFKVIRRDTRQAFCKLCGMLNDNSSTKFEHNLDIHKWWQMDACVPYNKVLEHLRLE